MASSLRASVHAAGHAGGLVPVAVALRSVHADTLAPKHPAAPTAELRARALRALWSCVRARWALLRAEVSDVERMLHGAVDRRAPWHADLHAVHLALRPRGAVVGWGLTRWPRAAEGLLDVAAEEEGPALLTLEGLSDLAALCSRLDREDDDVAVDEREPHEHDEAWGWMYHARPRLAGLDGAVLVTDRAVTRTHDDIEEGMMMPTYQGLMRHVRQDPDTVWLLRRVKVDSSRAAEAHREYERARRLRASYPDVDVRTTVEERGGQLMAVLRAQARTEDDPEPLAYLTMPRLDGDDDRLTPVDETEAEIGRIESADPLPREDEGSA